MIVQFRNEKVSNHGSIPITIDCNVVAFIDFEEGFHQPIKRTKHMIAKFARRTSRHFVAIAPFHVHTTNQVVRSPPRPAFSSGNITFHDMGWRLA
ncbi:hypothetical protein TNCV_1642101 [Trichonephila clavipes]|nr:hypothetical protein TNCV_1642101 [Trichonephila clavipes]